jgi:glucosylglycerate phosphorylase
MRAMDRIAMLLCQLYGEREGPCAFERIRILMASTAKHLPPSTAERIPDEKEVILITYADTLRQPQHPPLQTFHTFAQRYLKQTVSTIHFLPFFPFSSDDGFSVIDYLQIDPGLGSWDDVHTFTSDFRLMFDWVINHVSAKSPWFKGYLDAEPQYHRLAIEVDPSEDLSMVTRPRSLPLLTPYEKMDGRTAYLWTTFSADQIDLNFRSIDVLVDMVRVMLAYVEHGAAILRLDAIAYLWKEIGTACIHLPQTHMMVKLFRAILDAIAPHVLLITETNVPHKENISYFGAAGDEAQVVYNFSLPPLLLYCILNEDVSHLSRWAKTLDLPDKRTTFLNFTASHDGIGVRPLEGIIPSEEIDTLVAVVTSNGGAVSYKQNPDGTESPYELNITYVDAVRGDGADGDVMHARRFLATQAIALVLPGVPAIYIHSLLGSRNWGEGVRLTGRARTINRAKLDMDHLISEIENPQTFRSRVFSAYRAMIDIRRMQPAFHPKAGFDVLEIDRRVFAIARHGGGQRLIALTSIAPDEVKVDTKILGTGSTRDLISNRRFSSGAVAMKPYEILWLTPV